MGRWCHLRDNEGALLRGAEGHLGPRSIKFKGKCEKSPFTDPKALEEVKAF
jgi:hypothetical protein